MQNQVKELENLNGLEQAVLCKVKSKATNKSRSIT